MKVESVMGVRGALWMGIAGVTDSGVTVVLVRLGFDSAAARDWVFNVLFRTRLGTRTKMAIQLILKKKGFSAGSFHSYRGKAWVAAKFDHHRSIDSM
jgi:hypothetical protein